jgi:hypothetical protein
MTRNPVNPFLHFGPAKALELARAKPPAPLRLGLRVANLGPHNLPLIRDTAGNFMEVLPAKLSAAGKPLVLNAAGKEVEVARVVVDPQAPPKFLDNKGATIATPQLQAHPQALRGIGMDAPALRNLEQPKFVFRINPSIINGKFNGPIFVLPSGTVINTVVGDSEGNVQMTQAGSLIYYGIAVNDVYAYYVTQINPVVTGNTSVAFPTKQADLTAIQNFATTKGHTLLDPNSLAMEIKTAWVDASTLPNPSDYSLPSIQGTSVLRLAPWGAPNNQTPNPLVATVAASNTQIISLNNDIHSQMNAQDVRSKYLFLGATWTENGAAPSTNFKGSNANGIVVGTSHLANSTLETFTQSETYVPGIFPGPGCLSCHTTNTVGVSHVFDSTQALP